MSQVHQAQDKLIKKAGENKKSRTTSVAENINIFLVTARN